MTTARPRVVSVGPHVPHSGMAHAGGRFLLAHLTALAAEYDVTVVAPGTPANLHAREHAPAALSVHCIDLGPAWMQTLRRGVFYPTDVLAGITPGAGMLSAAIRDEQVRRAIATADLVEIQWPQWLPLIPEIRHIAGKCPVVAVVHDVLTQSFERRLTGSSSWRIRETSRLRLRVTAARERELLELADEVLVFSRKDEAALRALGVSTPVDVIPPHVDWPRHSAGPSDTARVLFVGAMWRPENHEAIEWFLDLCWDEIRKARPGAELRVCGDRPPSRLRSRRDAGLTVTGFVEDLEAEYRGARVVVAPGRTSAGVNFKVLEAIAHGLPVVASPECAEGIVEIVGEDGFLCIDESAAAISEATIRALGEPALARTVGTRAHERLRRWKEDQAARPTTAIYDELLRL